jgi:MFS family permease
MRVYARLLRVSPMKPLLAATLVARLPIGINGLAAVLFLREETGSFAVAGAAAGALALGAGLGAPVAARLVDRFGPRTLLVLATVHAAGLLGLLALGSSGAPDAATVAAALLAGVALPPTSSVMRALYPRLLRGDAPLIQSAYALDSVLTEMLFILGPLFTAVLVATLDAGAALVLSAAAVTIGVSCFLAVLPPRAPDGGGSEREPVGRLGALRSPGLRTLVLAMLPVGFALGALEVGLPAFADDHGQPELAGLLIAIWSLGSAAGGIVYGARARSVPLAALHVRMAIVLPLGFLPLLLVDSPLAMAILVIPAGLFIAPLIATRNELAGVVAPAGTETEAFTWPLTALVSGVAFGAAAAGGIVEAADWRAAVVAATLASALGALLALTRRGTLAEPVLD